MRQIVLDTETTGLDPSQGHRIIEIGCIELVNRRLTGKVLHQYINPEREIDEGALAVHGISREDLEDKPRFVDIAQTFLDFIRGAELIIHNAPFDVGFLDAELRRVEIDAACITDLCRVLDTLALARNKHPGQRNSLDALCKRYEIDNSHRNRHGALLDAELLAGVYLAMTGGQAGLFSESGAPGAEGMEADSIRRLPADRPVLPVIRANRDEQRAHETRLVAIDVASGGKCLWLRRTGKTSGI